MIRYSDADIETLIKSAVVDDIIKKLDKKGGLSNLEYEFILEQVYKELDYYIIKSYHDKEIIRDLYSMWSVSKKDFDVIKDADKVVLGKGNLMEENCIELLKGIKITSNNLIKENISTLCLQRKQLEIFDKQSYSLRIKSHYIMQKHAKDFMLPAVLRNIDAINDSVKKIKVLSKQYVIKK